MGAKVVINICDFIYFLYKLVKMLPSAVFGV